MAMSPVYALRETGQNLWRNSLLTLATIITIGVSLWMFGSFYLFDYAVANATQRWEGGIEFVVWVHADASEEQSSAIREAVTTNPQIRSHVYVNQEEAYEEFKELFADTPEFVNVIDPSVMPPSYRVVPVDPDAEVVEELVSQFRGRPGVRQVVSANDTIRAIQQQADRIGFVFFVGSIVLLGAATLLILTNIVSAIRSRAREIEIMKVVGATNWFIRVPFMLEGLVQAAVGALLAWGGLYGVDRYVIDELNNTASLELFTGFQVTDDELLFTSGLVLVIAVAVSVVGSAVAVAAYMDK